MIDPLRRLRPRRSRLLVALVVVAFPTMALSTLVGIPPAGARDDYRWPLEPRPAVERAFAPGAHDWLPGHRGVDLAGSDGVPVRAVGAGTVVFAGQVGGKPVVSIEHGNGLRSTYEPVVASVERGRLVTAGQIVGVLRVGHEGCAVEACLHLGLRRGQTYLDPLGLFGGRRIVLRPDP
ncbi:M23 family metallopeptidase [Millisia brevis]|uniref:M23 family metallopeptidase n=1 Tax=Millisia brevis TaxID=264148 RepID=UPI0008351193